MAMDHVIDETGTCKVCLGSHDTLTTNCCGRILLAWEKEDIREGMDFVESRSWIDVD